MGNATSSRDNSVCVSNGSGKTARVKVSYDKKMLTEYDWNANVTATTAVGNSLAVGGGAKSTYEYVLKESGFDTVPASEEMVSPRELEGREDAFLTVVLECGTVVCDNKCVHPNETWIITNPECTGGISMMKPAMDGKVWQDRECYYHGRCCGTYL